MLKFVISRLLIHTILSVFLAVVIGPIIGAGIGAICRRIQSTVNASMWGAFLGCILVCTTPMIGVPGMFEAWGAGGGLGSLVVLGAMILVAIGGVIGSFIASTFAYPWFSKGLHQWFLLSFAGIYILMIISTFYYYYTSCVLSRGGSFCS